MKTIIRGGFAITMDDQIGDVADSDVLIDNQTIEYVGPRLETEPSAETIEADGKIVIPGLIDGHRHTWEALLRGISVDWTLAHYYQGLRVVTARHYRPEDLYAANLIGILDGLDAGVTTILDWSHNINSPEHADAAISANFDSGARVVFAYGNSNDEWLPVSDVPHSRDAVRIRQQYFSSDDQLVTMQLGPRGPQYATDQVNRGDIELARELGLRMSMSVGDGEWGKTGPLFKMRDEELLGPDIGYVHCTSLTDAELQIIADSGGLAVISPDLEAQMWGHPATLRLMDLGLKPSLSVDCVTSISGDLFGVMRTTLSVQRAWDHHVAEQRGETLEELKLSARDVLELATKAGAAFGGLEDKVGSITPGKQADLVLIDTKGINLSPLNNAIGAVVLGSQRGDVDTVLVAGDIVKRDGELTDVDVPHVIEMAETGRDHVLAESGYPLHENWIPPSYEPR